MRNIITILAIGCISVFMITPHKTNAQWVCYYTPGPKDHIATLGVGCNDWYHYAPHPDIDIVPIKYIRVAYHIIQDENGGNNIPETGPGKFYLGLIINDAISRLRNLDSPQLNPPYIWPPITSPHIIDSRIQFALDAIYFHRDAELWDWNDPNHSTDQRAQASYNKFVVN
ncbi:MAG: hypothetical protein U1C46_11935, partial [Bacteroidales bacterium]|nr:hypothetical protein [Bacteroidales bacterium]